MSFVIDASVAVKWFFPEPGHLEAIQLLASKVPFHAPDLIVAETSNVISKRFRKNGISLEHAERAIAALPAMFQELHGGADLASRALQWSNVLNHSAYDCFYIACAERTGCNLISEDRRLRFAAANADLIILSLAEALARLKD